MGRDDVTVHGVRVMFTSVSSANICSVLYVLGVIRTLPGWSGPQDTELPILYIQYLKWWFSIYMQSLQWWFSLYATSDMCWFGVCWGHDTDVSRTGMCTAGGRRPPLSIDTSQYVSQDPHQGPEVVLGYTYVTCEGYTPSLIYIGVYSYKYIGHETTNSLGSGGPRSTNCRRSG